jgi:hypothetical protein
MWWWLLSQSERLLSVVFNPLFQANKWREMSEKAPEAIGNATLEKFRWAHTVSGCWTLLDGCCWWGMRTPHYMLNLLTISSSPST